MTFAAETVLGAEASFAGRLTGEDLSVHGRFEGDLDLKGCLRIGAQAHVRATVQAASVEINGEFEGEVHAEALVFTETARGRGVFWADRITVKEGAVVEGAVNIDAGALAKYRETVQAPSAVQAAAQATPAPAAAASGLTPIPPGQERRKKDRDRNANRPTEAMAPIPLGPGGSDEEEVVIHIDERQPVTA